MQNRVGEQCGQKLVESGMYVGEQSHCCLLLVKTFVWSFLGLILVLIENVKRLNGAAHHRGVMINPEWDGWFEVAFQAVEIWIFTARQFCTLNSNIQHFTAAFQGTTRYC